MKQREFIKNPFATGDVEPNDWCSRAMPWLIIGGIWMVFFGPMMAGKTVVGYRDSANLYYPMFKALSEVWGTGRVPLWNPYCNFGFPSIADGSTSVFYPFKLIFAFSFLSFPQRYGVFLGLHGLIAAVNAFVLARAIGCRRPGATLSAVAFAFGAPVVFQVTNVIYLVSAAWLPLALSFIWSAVQGSVLNANPAVSPGYFNGVLGTACCCAMMVLGGDPQMVYHVGLIALATLTWASAIFLLRERGSDGRRIGGNCKQSKLGMFVRPLIWCGFLVVLTVGLSAVQLLPTQRLAQRSERAAGDRIVNVYSALAATNRGVPAGRIAKALLQNESQVVGQYQFSQPPWSLGETILPNVSGKPFPVNGRWTSQLAAADRVWFPSIYMGAFVLLLAASQFRIRGEPRNSVWLSWIGLFFLLGCFGWYGISWIWHEVEMIFSPNQDPAKNWAAPVGGVYWWMSMILPKYFSFRYPAKLFTLVAVVTPVLAGLGFDRLVEKSCRQKSCDTKAERSPIWLTPTALMISGVSLLVIFGGAFESLVRPFMNQLATTQNDIAWQAEFGPFDPQLAAQQVQVAVIHFSAFMVSLALAMCWWRRGNKKSGGGWAIWLLVVIVAIDLTVANRWLLAEVNATAFEADLEVPTQANAFLNADPFLPEEFLSQRSTNRLEELVLWQRQSLQPKHHLLAKRRQLGSFHSIWPTAYQQTVASLKASTEMSGNESIYQRLFGDDSSVVRSDVEWNAVIVEVNTGARSRTVLLPVLADHAWRANVVASDGGETLDDESFQLRHHSSDLLEIDLPAGRWEVQLEYWPTRILIGAVISGLSWFALFAWVVWRFYD